ncbi:MAG: TonB-dependent receptor [Flavobacteriaceae bacterium]|nr:TonB-dependent receptor [Flavobacteriaceae bacterium]
MRKLILPMAVLCAGINVVAQERIDSVRTQHIDELIVTSSRSYVNRSEAPISISKINNSVINQTKARTMWEIVNKTPGVYMRQLSDAEGSSMSIRQPMSTRNYFLYLEDGIPIRPQGFHNHNGFSLYNNVQGIDNIEIVKGPSSSIYGPESVGGTINVITKKAGENPYAMIGYQGDQWGMNRIQFNVSDKISENLGVFIGGHFGGNKGGSWRDRNQYTRNALNTRVDVKLTDKTDFTLASAYTNYNGESATGVTEKRYYAREFKESTNDYGYRIDGGIRTRATVTHHWDNNNESFLTLLHRYDKRELTGHSLSRVDKTNKFTSEISNPTYHSYGAIAQHLAKFSFLKSKFLIGSTYEYTDANTRAFRINIERDDKGFNKLVSKEPNNFTSNNDTKVTSIGLYTQFDFEPIENLRLQLGLRYDYFGIDYQNYLEKNPDLVKGYKAYKQLTPKVGATYKFDRYSGIYANYSQGFTPPPVNRIFAIRKYFDPTILNQPAFLYDIEAANFHNMEVGGWFGMLENKLKVDISLYQLLGKNEIVSVEQPNGHSQNESAGSTSHKGIELGITYNPVSDFTIRSSSAYALHKYDKFKLSAKKDYSGNYMENAPKLMMNNEIIYTPHWFEGFLISAEWQWLSPYYFDAENTKLYEDKGFLGVKGQSTLNLRAQYSFKNIEMFLSLINATNELFPTGYSTSRKDYNPGQIRTLGFGVQYKFKK